MALQTLRWPIRLKGSPSPQSISLLLNRTGDTASLSLSSNPTQYGQPTSVEASIVPTVPGSASPGRHRIVNGGYGTDTARVSTNGTYSAPLGTVAVGSYSINGSYQGDGNYPPKPFRVLTFTVTKANTTTSVAASAAPGIFGTTINFKIAVMPAFSGVPAGSVTLWEGANLLGTATVDNTVARTSR